MKFSVSPVRILLIDPSPQRAEILEALLREQGYSEVHRGDLQADLVDQVAQLQPDVLLVEMESPQRDILEQLAILRDRHPTPVAVFCQDARAQPIRAAVESGVCAYVVEGIQANQVRPAIELAMATFSAFARLRKEAATARAALEDRKKIDCAKRMLMTQQGLNEEQAYQTLKRLAMDRQRKLSDAADELIATLRILGKRS